MLIGSFIAPSLRLYLAPRGELLFLFARNGSQLLAARKSLAPGRHNDAHAAHTLHRIEKHYTSAERPPSIAGSLHETEAFQPLLPGARWCITAHCSTGDLEAQQRQPVLQPDKVDETAVPRIVTPVAKHAPRAPQAHRVK